MLPLAVDNHPVQMTREELRRGFAFPLAGESVSGPGRSWPSIKFAWDTDAREFLVDGLVVAGQDTK